MPPTLLICVLKAFILALNDSADAFVSLFSEIVDDVLIVVLESHTVGGTSTGRGVLDDTVITEAM